MAKSAEPAQATPGTRLEPPDFFIVGHPKSGTTALYEMLRRHPQIFMPASKEPWFFATDARPRFQPPMEGRSPETLSEYLPLFSSAAPGQLVGEASSSYLWSRVAAEGISRLRPDARIIAILREPADFLRSQHLQLVQDHIEWEKDLARAIALEGPRREGRHVPSRCSRPQMLQYSDYVRYVEQLRRYEEVFPHDQLLVLIYDDFKHENAATVRRVLRFLDVDDSCPIEVLHANPTVRMRSQRLDEALHAVSLGRGPLGTLMKGPVKLMTFRGLRRRALRLTIRHLIRARPHPVDERLMLELRRRYKAEVVALSEHLGRDLVRLWGYDGLE